MEIRAETLAGMTFSEASQFIGERIILLVPELREMFSNYFVDNTSESKGPSSDKA